MLLRTAQLTRDAERCRQLGGDLYLTKPIRESALLDAILQLLAPGDAPTPPAVEAPPTPTRPLKVLVAEDNAVNQLFACHLLEQHGHRPVIAHNGVEALELASRERFDAALMDIEMPEMDGFAATAAIRERERQTGGHLPIVAVTAHALLGFRDRCLAAGMDAYLCKPVQATEMLATLRRLCPEEIISR
jgi:CheY-like chemotaxis protein